MLKDKDTADFQIAPGMISIPISFLLSAVILALLASVPSWKGLPVTARTCFAVLLGLLALEASLVGLRFALGVYDLLMLQRVLPVWIAPSAYLCFIALTCAPAELKRSVLRHGAIALVATAVLSAPIPLPGLIDGVIALSYLAYTILLTVLWRRGPDVFTQVPTRLTHRVRQFLIPVLLVMGASLIIDTFVAVLFSLRELDAAARTISYASFGVLLAIVATAFWFGARNGGTSDGKPTEVERERMTETVAAARELLASSELFRDSNLTLTRLARRVGVPDRALSQAVNQIAGQSVSQFVNRIRLEEAARLLRETEGPVTQIQEQAGFLTRSNFYREFQRVFGMSPGAYRDIKQKNDR